ncbi:sulfatase-like hydrolase/transferase [bacterium]|nr:sulfatase-like hydrolase/transferase [bacterium]
MKTIMVMFDSLNRHMLEPYGCDWVKTPNFRRLAEKSVTFDASYVGSMPCMPARRELHTGRLNFLHRSWGPLEPFDDSMPEILKKRGVYTHLVSDHYHYWEEGGANYHTKYRTWEIERGQEGDPWKGVVGEIEIPATIDDHPGVWPRQDWVNRSYMPREEDQSQHLVFEKGLEFIRTNHGEDNWFLQIETFDPHEPYFTQKKYKDLYPHDYKGRNFDWPNYRAVEETDDEVQHCRYENAALVSMCDEHIGEILDAMDQYGLWEDTLLIVNTDHGFLLGEHGWWAKCRAPFWEEVAHTPLFIWDPRSARKDKRRKSLVQTIDLAPTILEFFETDRPEHMQGKVLRDTIDSDMPVREAGLFGIHGSHVNVTDGRYVYMRAPIDPANRPLYEYTLMPAHMRASFSVEELRDIRLAEPFSFTKGCRLMMIDSAPADGLAKTAFCANEFGTLLYDLETDPKQENPIDNPEVEEQMIAHLVRLMKENDAPPEQFQRLGLVEKDMPVAQEPAAAGTEN